MTLIYFQRSELYITVVIILLIHAIFKRYEGLTGMTMKITIFWDVT
jgi:hypothetical protein